jgi:hypothetical protein
LQLRYLDDVLQRIATDADFEPAGWDAAEVAHFRLIAQCAEAALEERDLLALRLLRLRSGADDTLASVLLSAARMLTIKFEPTTTPMTAVFDVSRAGTGKR